jgi:DNA-directed RNA polymerase specialized sigma24 family protein
MSVTSPEAFPTTGWSHVKLAGSDSVRARAALNELCKKYWRPLYAFIRHRGLSPHDAEDMAQAYFGDLLDRGYLERADQARGRFRTFLIHDLKFFMSNELAKGRSKKRGGGLVFIPIDAAAAEARQEEYGVAPVTEPDAFFDRQWALETVKLARDRVAQEYADDGKHALFAVLQSGLVTSPNAECYARWELETGKNVGALKVALHRLRDRFREALEHQVMQTVDDESELKAEMRHLLHALNRQ